MKRLMLAASAFAAVALPGAVNAAEWEASCICKFPNRAALTAFVVVTAENMTKVKQTMVADGLKTSVDHTFTATACTSKNLCEGMKVANIPDGDPVTGTYKLFVRSIAGDLNPEAIKPGSRIRFVGERK